ncbi:Holliday junction resolvase RuvX [Bacteroidales bacterium OttesenSCG-928-C03]|nr:Holliday junction resolvase RuvX [Bacteroidales bacterium OttesenSCG-928-E04]MDL2309066.1 Holliday junction resolvase RuvX [Bacteroidales bacterium OttesenSCG-928-C03]MDL2326824.1 Holliday junction resolvase RuvX [Bacteroidales bacterium OttesenSCG-928-A14]
MGRILAIDYGQKRVGFAVSDELRICATPLETVHVSKAFDFLKDYLAKEKVDIIVIGEPKKMDFSNSASSRFIEPFVNRLRKEVKEVEIARFDERFTSKMAFQTMIDAGLKKKDRQNKALVDKISATLILQSFMHDLECRTDREKEI